MAGVFPYHLQFCIAEICKLSFVCLSTKRLELFAEKKSRNLEMVVYIDCFIELKSVHSVC